MARKSKQIVQHPLLVLARIAVETYVREGRIIPVPPKLPDDQRQPKGVYVSLIKHNELRGCVGSVRPIHESLAAEVIANAINAAHHDPRFRPLQADELFDMAYILDIVEGLQTITPEQIDPTNYGVVVQCKKRVGVVLPQTAAIDTAEAQLTLALGRAGLEVGDQYDLYRFRVQRLVEASGKYQPAIS